MPSVRRVRSCGQDGFFACTANATKRSFGFAETNKFGQAQALNKKYDALHSTLHGGATRKYKGLLCTTKSSRPDSSATFPVLTREPRQEKKKKRPKAKNEN